MILKINLAIYVLSSQDGNDNCSRKACPSLSCRYQIQDENACCSRCAVNRAEVGHGKDILLLYPTIITKMRLSYRCSFNQIFGVSLFQKKQAQKQIRLKKLRKLRRLRRIRDRKLRKKEELQNSGQQEQQLSN